MWGNRNGWIIAAALFALICVGVWQMLGFNQVSSPTAFGLSERNLSPLTIAAAPSSIVKVDGSGDGAALYRDAMAAVLSDVKSYEKFVQDGQLPEARQLKAIQLIVDATSLPATSILMQRPERAIGYFDYATPDDLNALDLAGQAALRVSAFHFANGKLDESKRYANAVFAMGQKMWAERVIFMQAFKAIGMMNGGAEMLKQVALKQGDEGRAKQLDDFLIATRDVTDQLSRMWKVINAVGGTPQADALVAKHAGDIFHFTRADAQKERLWRVESTLKLGRFKFNVGGGQGRPADQTQADFRLAELEKDADPAVAFAAKVARGLTLSDFRMIK
jgi:hypothetical protein